MDLGSAILRIYSGYVTVDQLVRSLQHKKSVESVFPSLTIAIAVLLVSWRLCSKCEQLHR